MHAHAALLGMILLERERIKRFLPDKVDEYRKMVEESLKDRDLPFWTYRGFYRAARIKRFWMRWTIAMLTDVLRNGRKSWLFVEALPIAREVL